MPPEHRPNPLNVPLRQPKPLGVLVNHEHTAVAVSAAKQNHRVMSEPIIQRGKPLPRPRVVKLIDGMNLPPERRKELARRNVPIPVEPCPLLPTRQAL